MTNLKRVLANFVPAAAVIRRGQVLFNVIGRKGHLGGFISHITKIITKL